MSPTNHQAGWVGEWAVHSYGNHKVRRWRASGPWRETKEEAERDMQHGASGDDLRSTGPEGKP